MGKSEAKFACEIEGVCRRDLTKYLFRTPILKSRLDGVGDTRTHAVIQNRDDLRREVPGC